MGVVYSILLVMTFAAWVLLLLSIPITVYEVFILKQADEYNYSKSMLATLGLCLWTWLLLEIIQMKGYSIVIPFLTN